MTRELVETPRPERGDILYTLIASVEDNLLGFKRYIERKGVPVEETFYDGASSFTADYDSIVATYNPACTLHGTFQGKERRFDLGNLVLINSFRGQDTVENEAEKILKAIGEVKDPESVRIWIALSKETLQP